MTQLALAQPVRAARPNPRAIWLLAAALLAAAVAVGAAKGPAWWHERQLESAHDSALAAGRQLAVNFTTLDYRTVDADAARVKAGATGDFAASYEKSWTDLRKLIVDNKSVSKVERSEAALVSGDLDSAVVIVGIVAPTSNTSIPQGEKKTYRMKLGLREVGSDWKVESLEFVG